MNIPNYAIARVIAFVLFVIGAVVAAVATAVDPKWLMVLLFSGLAALALS